MLIITIHIFENHINENIKYLRLFEEEKEKCPKCRRSKVKDYIVLAENTCVRKREFTSPTLCALLVNVETLLTD